MAFTHQWYGISAGALIARMWTDPALDLHLMLMAPGFSPNIDTQLHYSDIQANEVPTGLGYSNGGKGLTGLSSSYDITNDDYKLLADDLEWTSATFVTTHGVIYEKGSTGKWLWSILDFGGTQTASGIFQIGWATTDIALIVHVAAPS